MTSFGKAMRRRGAWLAALGAMALAGCTVAAPPAPPASGIATTPAAPAARAELPAGVQLAGLEESRLTELLGQPDLRRREESLQFWRYTYQGCALDFFLQGEADGTAGKVVHFDVRPVQESVMAVYDRCARLGARLAGLPQPADDDLPQVRSH
ncbi:hypothetical protein [Marinimicrococcus flavescens]|uniref:Outer membrane protein assembly factor BamE n=1 Tax=Marinimicrococcus flavescens TaxID=3031815 RepID=A0AAP3XR40_9PROT|nr:hypothetical protein [Marinimicrococcus flavescens]